MTRNFKQELADVRDRLTAAMRDTNPTRQYGSTIFLGLMYLAVTELDIRRSRTLKERRRCIREFDWAKRGIEKGILHLRESGKSEAPQGEKRQQALP